MKKFLLIVFCAITVLLSSCDSNKNAAGGVRLIVDTDLGPDYDDVGALAVMHALAEEGYARPLAVVSSNIAPQSIPCIEAINGYYGRADLPVGVAKTPDALDLPCEREIKWTDSIPAHYPTLHTASSQAGDAVSLYRRLLAENPDSSVTICNIGAFTNLRALMHSQGDEYSPLTGYELIARKSPRLVVMAACFPEGREYNIACNPAASKDVIDNWPGDIIFCGFEIGYEIITGPRLVAMPGENNPVKETYAINMSQGEPQGRWSWDQATVLAAVRGPEPYFNAIRGTMETDTTGYNRWRHDAHGRHISLSAALPSDSLTVIIENLMMKTPAK